MVGDGLVTHDLLEVNHLSKQIGGKRILKDVSFQASTGDLLVITGPNGAGKTTLMRVITGLAPKSGGEILLNGVNYNLSQRQIGYVSHKPMLYETLSVQENLVFFARMCGKLSLARIEELLRLVDLWLYRYEPVAVLSRGMQQRLALARTILLQPRLILYDEPFTGLDQDGQTLLRKILEDNRAQSIQLVITHELNLLKGLFYQVLNLQDGELVQGSEQHV